MALAERRSSDGRRCAVRSLRSEGHQEIGAGAATLRPHAQVERPGAPVPWKPERDAAQRLVACHPPAGEVEDHGLAGQESPCARSQLAEHAHLAVPGGRIAGAPAGSLTT